MMGEGCSISVVLHICQVLGALINPSLEHEITTAIMGKKQTSLRPSLHIKFPGRRVSLFFPMKIIKIVELIYILDAFRNTQSIFQVSSPLTKKQECSCSLPLCTSRKYKKFKYIA